MFVATLIAGAKRAGLPISPYFVVAPRTAPVLFMTNATSLTPLFSWCLDPLVRSQRNRARPVDMQGFVNCRS